MSSRQGDAWHSMDNRAYPGVAAGSLEGLPMTLSRPVQKGI